MKKGLLPAISEDFRSEDVAFVGLGELNEKRVDEQSVQHSLEGRQITVREVAHRWNGDVETVRRSIGDAGVERLGNLSLGK